MSKGLDFVAKNCEGGSLVRASGVISLIVLENDREMHKDMGVREMWEKIIDSLVTVDVSWLLKWWDKVLDIDMERAIVRYVAIRENRNRADLNIEESSELFNLLKSGGHNCKFYNNLNQFLRRKSDRFNQPLALKVHSSAYSSRRLLT